MIYYVCWQNGVADDFKSQVYKNTLGNFENAHDAFLAFLEWRKNNPPSYGWKQVAWIENEKGDVI